MFLDLSRKSKHILYLTQLVLHFHIFAPGSDLYTSLKWNEPLREEAFDFTLKDFPEMLKMCNFTILHHPDSFNL